MKEFENALVTLGIVGIVILFAVFLTVVNFLIEHPLLLVGIAAMVGMVGLAKATGKL